MIERRSIAMGKCDKNRTAQGSRTSTSQRFPFPLAQSSSSSCPNFPLFVLLLLILGMCQVSEECPAVCECKWKSGKESVICANAKAKLTEIPSGLDPGTQVLNLSRNSIKNLPANVFLSLNLLNLQKICLSECSLKSLDRLAFAKLKNLVELDLSGNRQEFIPSHAFSQIPELRDLKINSNPISRLSNDAFIDLSRLVRLELSGCRVGTIEARAFRGLPALEWLRLDNNRLFTVQAISFFPLRSLHGLEIHGNPWNCSCTLQPFREWMSKNNVPFGVPPVCSQPARLVGKLWNELELEDFACLPKLYKTSSQQGASPSPLSSVNTQKQQSLKILEGENTTLSCQWESTPDTKIRWWNGNKPVGTTGANGVQSGFLVSETFRWEPDLLGRGARGDSKSLEYSFSSILQGNQTFFNGGGIGVKTSSLVVIRTTPRDAGTYTCKAESRAGSVTANYTLIVVQNKTEHLTGRFLLFGAVIAALLTLAVSLLLVCVVFGSNRRHYQSSRISTDDKIELNHVGSSVPPTTRQNGGMHNHHNHLNNHNHHPYNYSNNNGGNHVTTNNSILSRTLSEENNSGGNIGGGGGRGSITSGSDKSKYKAVPTTEPDDSSSSSEIENNGSDQEDGGELGQKESSSGGGSISTIKAIVSGKGDQVKQPFSLKFGQCAETKIGVVGESSQQDFEKKKRISEMETNKGTSVQETLNGNRENGGEPSGSNSRLLSEHFNDKYPDLIDKEVSNGTDFMSLPRPNKNHPKQRHPHQLSYKQSQFYQKHGFSDITRGYFHHRRNNSDSQSPLLSRSYGNSTEKMTSSGISILSSSSTESSYMSPYQAPPPPYTISQGQSHHPHHPLSYRGSGGIGERSYKSHHHFHQNHNSNNPFLPNYASSSNYPGSYQHRQRLSMPTSPVHDHYLTDRSGGAGGGAALIHHHHRPHSGSHDEGRNGLLSPAGELGLSYVRTASSGPVGEASSSTQNVSYDYHAAQLAAFLEEYRQLQLELMRMSASLQNSNGTPVGESSGGSGGGGSGRGIGSPPSDTSSSVGNSNSISAIVASASGTTLLDSSSAGVGSGGNVNQASSLMHFKSSTSRHHHNQQGISPQQHHHHQNNHHHQQQLKSILKNSGNNNNYVA